MWVTHSTQIVKLPLGNVPLASKIRSMLRPSSGRSLFSSHVNGFLYAALAVAQTVLIYRAAVN
jgi:hypothetical protein